MRSSLLALSLSFFAVGCSEYDLSGKGGTVDTNDDDTDVQPDTDIVYTDECPDQTFPGYATGQDADCENEVETGTFTPVIKWEASTFPSFPGSNQMMSQPVVADLDQDGLPEIIAVMYGSANVVRALHGDGSGQVWSISDNLIEGQGGVAVGEIDGDLELEVVVAASGGVIVLDHDGRELWRNVGVSAQVYGTSDNPAIADMDGDGVPEITVGAAIFSNTGTVLGRGQYGKGGSPTNVGTCSFAADIDADGHMELITGNAVYRMNGTAIWHNSETDGYPAVADFDGDGDAEIVLGGGGQLRMLDTDGTRLWQAQVDSVNSYYGGPPTIADFDGDGEPEIGVATGSGYYVFEGDGTQLWRANTDDSSSGNTGSAVFDFEGDGAAEVVYADQTTLWVYDGATGAVKLASNHHSNATWLEYPTIADVDADGHAEIVVANTQYINNYTGFTVFGDADNSWQPGRQIWNQYAYSITNVNDDGTIPSYPDLNWDSYNNFRSGDTLSGNGLSTVDLVIAQADVCNVECEDGRLVVWVNAGNEGAVDLATDAGGTVDMYAIVNGSEQLLDSKPTGAISVGNYNDSIQFEITSIDPTTIEALVFRVRSNERDCDPSNNEMTWSGPFCD